MNNVEIYVLLEYSALISVIAGIMRWKRISLFLKWHTISIAIMLAGDAIANSPSLVRSINSSLNFMFRSNTLPENNLSIYFISYPLSLFAVLNAWLNVPEYNSLTKKRIYLISFIPILIVAIWSVFQNWILTPFYFQDYALLGLLHTAVLLVLSLQFFHLFLNTELFEAKLENSLFIVACSHMIFAIPSTLIIVFSEIYNSKIAADIWIGRELAYCISNFVIVLAFFVKK